MSYMNTNNSFFKKAGWKSIAGRRLLQKGTVDELNLRLKINSGEQNIGFVATEITNNNRYWLQMFLVCCRRKFCSEKYEA